MDAISTKLKELKEQYGPESYGVLSPQAYQVLWTLGRRFLNVHGSPNYMHSAICALQRAASKKICLGSASCDPGQLDKTKLLVVWGANPENSAINQGKPIDRVKAIENGLQVIDIRPMMDPLGAKADIWVPIRPGTDGALALAILHVIIGEDLYDHDFTANWCSGFDQLAQHVQQYTPEWAANITGLPVDQIYQIARMMGTTKPMGILYGNGIGDQQNDGNWTCISICLIEAITGNLDIAGGGGASMTMPPSLIKTNKFDILTDRLPASPEDEEKGYYAGMAKLVAPETPRWYQNPKTWESGPNSAYFKALRAISEWIRTRCALFWARRATRSARPASPRRLPKCSKSSNSTSCTTRTGTRPATTPTTSFRHARTTSARSSSRRRTPRTARSSASTSRLRSRWANPAPTGSSISTWRSRWATATTSGTATWTRACASSLTVPASRSRTCARRTRASSWSARTVPSRPSRSTRTTRSSSPTCRTARFSATTSGLAASRTTPRRASSASCPNTLARRRGIAETPELAEEYPLIISDVHAYRLCNHSYYVGVPYLRELQPYPWVKINPATAKKYGIEDGDWMKVESPHGWVKLVAEYFEGISPEVLMTRRGWWQDCEELGLPGYGCFDGGSDSTVLYDSTIENFDPFHSAMAKQTLVKISKLEEGDGNE